jgi:uncharacterized protein YkwD
MGPIALAWCLVLFAVSSCGVHKRVEVAAPRASFAESELSPLQIESDVFQRVNIYRRAKGLPALAVDRRMSELAREHARWMASRRTMTHRGFKDRFDRLQSPDPMSVAENVAYNLGHSDPARVAVEGWVESSGHRRNMTGRDDRLSGVGVARGSGGAWYFTQLYGQRR